MEPQPPPEQRQTGVGRMGASLWPALSVETDSPTPVNQLRPAACSQYGALTGMRGGAERTRPNRSSCRCHEA